MFYSSAYRMYMIRQHILLAKIAALLRRAYPDAGEESLCWKGAVLHPESGRLDYQGQAVELTRNEQKILWYLFRHAGTICAPLARKGTSIIERIVDFEKGEEAVTHYETLGHYGPHSLVKLKLETGRTHQIRVHMQYLGYPLIGDYLYNPDMTHISRQALHSHRLSFPHPMTGEPVEFTAPLPEDMQEVLRVTSSSPASKE